MRARAMIPGKHRAELAGLIEVGYEWIDAVELLDRPADDEERQRALALAVLAAEPLVEAEDLL